MPTLACFGPAPRNTALILPCGKTAPLIRPRYIVIFKSKQADNLEQAFKEFTAKKLKQQERPSIRKALSAMKQKTAARNRQQAKEKIKERGLSL